MSFTWGENNPQIVHRPFGPGDYLRIVRRGLALAGVVFGCLLILLCVRIVERPLFGVARPWTPKITQFVCRATFQILGIKHRVEGRPMSQPGAMVANHSSWLDIFALNAPASIYFVAKSEVAHWPGIGWLAKATGTVFVERNRHRAADQKRVFEDRLRAGHQLMFFPEGTSTDGRRVLPFKSTLFAAFYADGLPIDLAVQPVTLRYQAPAGEDHRYYGWWGNLGFAAHLIRVLSTPQPGQVTVIYSPPVALRDTTSRKELAQDLQATVTKNLGLTA